MSKIQVGVQLYTLRDDCARDFRGTVRQVAEMGYAGVELCGDGGLTPTELGVFLKDLGLEAAGYHFGIDDLRNNLEKIIQQNREIGNKRIVCPYLPQPYQDKGRAGYEEVAGILSETGKVLAQEGMSLSYHNHSFEFGKSDGEYFLDILFKNADPKYLKAELDTYWVQHGGADPVEYINKYAGRIELLHIKDMGNDKQRSFKEIGSGILQWDAIFAAAPKAGVQWYLVEQDSCAGPPIESVRKSFEFLKSKGIA